MNFNSYFKNLQKIIYWGRKLSIYRRRLYNLDQQIILCVILCYFIDIYAHYNL